ncbi:hypothetical protein ABIA95_008658 [Bradyrhizobium sp. LA8.1]
MKSSIPTSTLSTFVGALAFMAMTVPTQAQTAVQPAQTPAQADQAREQDRNRAANETIGRDWKAQEGNRDNVGSVGADKDHETVGRDWRAHPDRLDR